MEIYPMDSIVSVFNFNSGWLDIGDQIKQTDDRDYKKAYINYSSVAQLIVCSNQKAI